MMPPDPMMDPTLVIAAPAGAMGPDRMTPLTDEEGNGISIQVPADFPSGSDAKPGGTYILPFRCKLVSREGADEESKEGENINAPGEGATLDLELLAMGTPTPVPDQRPMSFPKSEADEGEMMDNLAAAKEANPSGPPEGEDY